MSMQRFTRAGRFTASKIIKAVEEKGGKERAPRIAETWLDYGAGIAWETILYHSKAIDMTCQALSPREFDDMNEGILQYGDFKEIVERILD